MQLKFHKIGIDSKIAVKVSDSIFSYYDCSMYFLGARSDGFTIVMDDFAIRNVQGAMFEKLKRGETKNEA